MDREVGGPNIPISKISNQHIKAKMHPNGCSHPFKDNTILGRILTCLDFEEDLNLLANFIHNHNLELSIVSK